MKDIFSREKPTIGLINVGPYEMYGDANEVALKILFSQSCPFIINGGFNMTRGMHRRHLKDVINQQSARYSCETYTCTHPYSDVVDMYEYASTATLVLKIKPIKSKTGLDIRNDIVNTEL